MTEKKNDNRKKSTSIQLSPDGRDVLKSKKKPSESYEDVLKRIGAL